jgi:hypothetical protein
LSAASYASTCFSNRAGEGAAGACARPDALATSAIAAAAHTRNRTNVLVVIVRLR